MQILGVAAELLTNVDPSLSTQRPLSFGTQAASHPPARPRTSSLASVMLNDPDTVLKTWTGDLGEAFTDQLTARDRMGGFGAMDTDMQTREVLAWMATQIEAAHDGFQNFRLLLKTEAARGEHLLLVDPFSACGTYGLTEAHNRPLVLIRWSRWRLTKKDPSVAREYIRGLQATGGDAVVMHCRDVPLQVIERLEQEWKKNAAVLEMATAFHIVAGARAAMPRASTSLLAFLGWSSSRFTKPDKLTRELLPCSACGKLAEKQLACARCHVAVYCDKECQAAHWPAHKASCKEHKLKEKAAAENRGLSQSWVEVDVTVNGLQAMLGRHTPTDKRMNQQTMNFDSPGIRFNEVRDQDPAKRTKGSPFIIKVQIPPGSNPTTSMAPMMIYDHRAARPIAWHRLPP